MDRGTPRELKPIAEQVLAWVADARRKAELWGDGTNFRSPTLDELRRIELCALVAINVANFADLYDLQILELSLETDLSEKAAEEHKQDDSLEEQEEDFYWDVEHHAK